MDDMFDEIDENELYEENYLVYLTEIIKLSKKISRLYQAMIYDGLNNEILMELKKAKNIEDSLYKEMDLDFNKELEIRNVLFELSTLHGKDINNTFSSVCNEDVEDLWLYRIIKKIAIHKDNDLGSFLKKLRDNKNDIDVEELRNIQEDKFEKSLYDDFNRAFVYFLNEYIEQSDDEGLKFYLNKVKYQLIYVFDFLEDSMLFEKTSSPKDLFLQSRMISGLLNMENEQINSIQEHLGIECLDHAVSSLELIDEFENDENKNLVVILSTYIRAGLSILYNHENYEDIIEEFKYDYDLQDDCEDIEFITNHFKEENNIVDREKCKYLSFKNLDNC